MHDSGCTGGSQPLSEAGDTAQRGGGWLGGRWKSLARLRAAKLGEAGQREEKAAAGGGAGRTSPLHSAWLALGSPRPVAHCPCTNSWVSQRVPRLGHP